MLAGERLGILIVRGLGCRQGCLRGGHGVGQCGLILHHGRVSQLLQFVRDIAQGHFVAGDRFDHGFGRSLHLVALGLLGGGFDRVRQGHRDRRRTLTAHQGRQHAGVGVVLEERFDQIGLHVQHVNQEAQRTQVGGQAVEHASVTRFLHVGVGLQQVIDVFAHANRGVAGHVQAQHGQHAAHGLQLRGHVHQRRWLRGITEEQVDVLFGFVQVASQLLHHAADGLAVGDTAVQVFHPRFQRLSRLALADRVDAAGQAMDAVFLIGVVELAVFQRSLLVEKAGGHFHGQAGLGRLTRLHGLVHGLRQRLSQHLAIGVQPLERLGHQGELFVQPAQAQQLTGRNRRPAIFGTAHAFDRLRHPGRVVTTQTGFQQIDRRMLVQAKGAAHVRQHRIGLGIRARCLRAEEQQLLRQTVRGCFLALNQHTQLLEQ